MADQEKKTEDKEQKQEKQEKQEIRIEDEEDLLKLLQQLYKDSDKKVKVKIVNKMGISIKIFENILLDFLVMTIINMGLLLGICGWFKVIEVKAVLLSSSFKFSYLILVQSLKVEGYAKHTSLLVVLVVTEIVSPFNIFNPLIAWFLISLGVGIVALSEQ